MTKVKCLLLFIMFAILILIFPSIANAADYATDPGVNYTRTIPSNDGTIKLNFTGLELDVMQAYEFALVKQGGTPEKWFGIDNGYTATTASVTLKSTTNEIRDVLKVTDTGYIYIRKQNDTQSNYVLEAYQVDLKLPYLQSLAYTTNNTFYDVIVPIYKSIGCGKDYTYKKWQKVNDKKLIEDFLAIKNNGGDISALESSLPTAPTSGYSTTESDAYINKDDGLYLLWVKRTGENCKDIYSCIVHDGLKEATKVEQYIAGLDVEKPTVKTIAVTSPKEGTYKTGQTVKITVTFSEEITGEKVPTLKIKFGTSEERTVTNGTISGKTIVYSYNIVDGDKGQLAVTGYAGGAIKDAAGNDAIIESKVVSGNAIKANVEGATTNNTQNQDQTNNETGKETTEKEENKNVGTTDKEDDGTQATGKIPHAGEEIGIVFIILTLIIAGVVIYSKYKKMEDIL